MEYHIEHRVPSKGESFIDKSSIDPRCPSAVILESSSDVSRVPQYVLAKNSPRGDHPSAMLIRVDEEVYGRSRVSETGAVIYTSVNNSRDFHHASDITDWEDVYDENAHAIPPVPTAPVIRVNALSGDRYNNRATPFYAMRRQTDCYYQDDRGALIRPGQITAWDDISTDGDEK